MFSFSEMMGAFSTGVITALVIMIIGAFVERTSVMMERNRLRKAYKNDKNRGC